MAEPVGRVPECEEEERTSAGEGVRREEQDTDELRREQEEHAQNTVKYSESKNPMKYDVMDKGSVQGRGGRRRAGCSNDQEHFWALDGFRPRQLCTGQRGKFFRTLRVQRSLLSASPRRYLHSNTEEEGAMARVAEKMSFECLHLKNGKCEHVDWVIVVKGAPCRVFTCAKKNELLLGEFSM